MFETNKKLEVSEEQLEAIEAALHTQSKILHVQADAGGQAALEKLNTVKGLLALLTQHKPAKTREKCNPLGWFGLSRGLL